MGELGKDPTNFSPVVEFIFSLVAVVAAMVVVMRVVGVGPMARVMADATSVILVMMENQHIDNGKLYCVRTAVDRVITSLSSLPSGGGNFESYSTLNSERRLFISCQDLAAYSGPLSTLPDESKSHVEALARMLGERFECQSFEVQR